MIVMFWGLLFILAIASAIAIYYLIREEKLYNKRESEYKTIIGRLEQELSKKDKETEERLARFENDFSDKEKRLNTQILELKDQLLQSQDVLKKEDLNRTNLEVKLFELQDQLAKLNRDLSSNIQIYNGLKGQYDKLERDIEKLREELVNKDATFKTEQSLHQQLKEKYDSLFSANKRDPAS